MVLKLEGESESPVRLLQAQIAGQTPRVSHSVGWGQALVVCINTFSDAAAAAG